MQFDILPVAPSPLIDGQKCLERGWITLHVDCTVCSVEQLPTSTDRILERCADVFEGLGSLSRLYHIDIDPDVPPVQ